MSEVPAKFADGARTIPTPPALPALPTEENSLGYVDHPTSSTSTRELADGGWTLNDDLDPECPEPPRETVCEFELTDGRRRVGWYHPNVWVEAFDGPTHRNGDVVRYRPMTPEPVVPAPSAPPVVRGGADIARVPRRGEPLPNRSFEGWVGVACRLRDDAESLLSEVGRLRAQVEAAPAREDRRLAADELHRTARAFRVDRQGASAGALERVAAWLLGVPSVPAPTEDEPQACEWCAIHYDYPPKATCVHVLNGSFPPFVPPTEDVKR